MMTDIVNNKNNKNNIGDISFGIYLCLYLYHPFMLS